MAYIGKGLQDTATANITVDRMTGDNAPNGVRNTLTCSLSKAPASINDITVFVDGIQQRPGTDYTLSNWTITFSTAPQAGQNVVAVCKGASWQDYVADSTVTAEKIKDGAVTNAKLTGSIDAAKLIGTLPAIDGSALTGIVSEATIATSDPLINTNETTLGKIYINKTSGEVFVLIDATTDENIWYNVGGGVGDTTHCYGGVGGGTAYGFTSCGQVSGTILNLINRFSFASGNAETWGNCTLARYGLNATGASSSTHGFVLNGSGSSNSPANNVIDKFPFASSAGATDFGDLNFQRAVVQCSYDSTRAYVSGGRQNATNPHFTDKNIQTFLFANNSSNTNHGDLTDNRQWLGSASSKTHGYVMGGANDGGIDKFAFASSGASRMSGDLNGGVATTRFQFGSSGHSSDTRGYNAGGTVLNAFIDSFSFASDSAAGTSHSNLVKGVYTHAGSSSTTHGFLSGNDGGSTTIQNFSFDSNNITNNVGDLTRTYSSTQGNED
jgi:hypothetical protein